MATDNPTQNGTTPREHIRTVTRDRGDSQVVEVYNVDKNSEYVEMDADHVAILEEWA